MRVRRNRINVLVGKRLRALRKDGEYSQEVVAKKLGILRASLVNIEYGRQNVNIVQLCKLASIYDVPVDQIVADMEQP